jgi:hypothetical protein
MNILNTDINTIQIILESIKEKFPKIDAIGLSIDLSTNENAALNSLYRIREIINYTIEKEESKHTLIPLP